MQQENVKISVSLLNIGNDDEEDVELRITNSDLGLNLEEIIPEIIAEANEPESMFSKTYAFNVPADVESKCTQYHCTHCTTTIKNRKHS